MEAQGEREEKNKKEIKPFERCNYCGKSMEIHTIDQIICPDCWTIKTARNLLYQYKKMGRQ